jgi:hypothetical protein
MLAFLITSPQRLRSLSRSDRAMHGVVIDRQEARTAPGGRPPKPLRDVLAVALKFHSA